MGATNSASVTDAALPVPQAWLKKRDHALPTTAALLASISSLPVEEFLNPGEPSLLELQAAVWVRAWESDVAWAGWTAAYKVNAATAMQLDHRLNGLVQRCVPKKVSESEFWRCFFCQAHHALSVGSGEAAKGGGGEEDGDDDEEEEDEDDDDVESQIEELAEELAEAIEETTERYEAELLEPARAEIARLKEEQKMDLADATSEVRAAAHGHASAESVGTARAYRRAVDAAQRRYDELLQQMREEHATLRSDYQAAKAALLAKSAG